MLATTWKWIRCSVAAVAITGVAVACSNSTGPNTVRLAAQSLNVPATVAANAPFTADVVVGRGACDTFDGFSAERTALQLVLTPRAHSDPLPPGTACTSQLILEHHTYTVRPPYGTSLMVSVRQPDGSLLTQQVTIQ